MERFQSAIQNDDPTVESFELKNLADDLTAQYAHAAEKAGECGFMDLTPQVIHGDWHPGNVLFVDAPGGVRPGHVAAVVDFDASRMEPRIVDLANGVLHFAMRSKPGESPAHWPHTLSARRLRAFISGWKQAIVEISDQEAHTLPWLMIEAAIAESVVPVAETGRFATVPGFPFLSMVREKVRWIKARYRAISRELTQEHRQ